MNYQLALPTAFILTGIVISSFQNDKDTRYSKAACESPKTITADRNPSESSVDLFVKKRFRQAPGTPNQKTC